MFFGPAKVNLEAADNACFLTKNFCGNSLERLLKTNPQWLQYFFSPQPFSLQKWNDTTQACCLTWLFRGLSQSNIRGKQQVMDRFANAVKSAEPKIFLKMLNCFSYTNEQFINFISERERETHVQYGMNILLSAEWVKSELSLKTIKTADKIGVYTEEEIVMMKGLTEALLSPFFNYWK